MKVSMFVAYNKNNETFAVWETFPCNAPEITPTIMRGDYAEELRADQIDEWEQETDWGKYMFVCVDVNSLFAEDLITLEQYDEVYDAYHSHK